MNLSNFCEIRFCLKLCSSIWLFICSYFGENCITELFWRHSNNHTGFQSNNAFTTNFAFLHTKLSKFSNLHVLTILFCFRLTFCPQYHPDDPVHPFCSSHMFEYFWVLPLLPSSGTSSHQKPLFEVSFSPLSYLSDCPPRVFPFLLTLNDTWC